MSHISLPGASLYRFIQQIDLDIVKSAQACPCLHCGGRLDRADYNRKPRGVSLGLDDDLRRYSLCCRQDGCRKRLTCQSLRFMGRKVFLGFFILFASSLPKRVEGPSVHRISNELSVSPQTLSRWLSYWKEDFSKTSFWRREQGLFMPPLAQDNHAAILISRFSSETVDPIPWSTLLKFLAPCFI